MQRLRQWLVRTPSELAERSLQVRRASKRIRDGLASGRLTIADVTLHQPAEIGDRVLFEVLLFTDRVGRHRLHELNARAVAQQVNLRGRARAVSAGASVYSVS